jgi:hypothetical protein
MRCANIRYDAYNENYMWSSAVGAFSHCAALLARSPTMMIRNYGSKMEESTMYEDDPGQWPGGLSFILYRNKLLSSIV